MLADAQPHESFGDGGARCDSNPRWAAPAGKELARLAARLGGLAVGVGRGWSSSGWSSSPAAACTTTRRRSDPREASGLPPLQAATPTLVASARRRPAAPTRR
eukprot:4258015-Prymnesium_polylepis.1